MRYKTLKTNVLDVDTLRKRMEKAQMAYADRVSELYLETMETWSGEHGSPDASPEWLQYGKRARRINIYVRGGYREIYVLLDHGYMRKFAMERDFKPKTHPGIIGSTPGKGGVARSKKSGAPRVLSMPRQVVARRFTETITQIVENGELTEYGNYEQYMREKFVQFVHARRSGLKTVR